MQPVISRFVGAVLNPAILVLFSLGLLLFFWGLAQFIRSLNSGGSKLEEGKQHMLWGIVGMFIMLSALTIISVISNTFGLGIDPRNSSSYNPDMNRLNNINFPPFH